MSGFDTNLITQFGLAGLMFMAFMFLLKWVLKTQDKILTTAEKERDASLFLIKSFQQAIDRTNELTTEQLKVSVSAIADAKREHEKIINTTDLNCNNIKESRDEARKEHERILAIADEQLKILVRINGFKH